MFDKTELLNQLLAKGKIALEVLPFLETEPAPLPERWDFERVEGMLLILQCKTMMELMGRLIRGYI